MPLSLDHDSGAAEMEDIFSIEDFLAAEQAKELVRFSTAGSVDDGKSTLIGRLLYDSQNVYEDHVRAVTKAASANVAAAIDFAQLTDGLRAEREQGITIDVAYRYFSTTHRKFIIADTPGHEQYTRNMATGASTADVAIILVDARKGILTQSRRHAYIASLLGTRHIVAAVNKMDLSSRRWSATCNSWRASWVFPAFSPFPSARCTVTTWSSAG
jgi:sulfate adenylyltransferase subunit 1